MAIDEPSVSHAPSIFSGRALDRSERVQIAVLVGLAAACAAFLAFSIVPEMLARDFTYPWRGAKALIDGQNPYEVIRPVGPSPFDMWFMYPLTAALTALPFALVPVKVAGMLFAGLGAALLTYVLTADGMGRLWLLLSAPFGLAVVLAQWSPILIAAAFLLPLAWVLTCKPIGLALFIARPSWRAAALCAAMVAVAFAVQPTWLSEWVRNAGTLPHHRPPVMNPLGAVALLALLRWRRPEARLVAAMAFIPQNLYFYDQLPLLLVARNGRTSFILALLSWLAWGVTRMRCRDPYFCGPEAELPILTLLFVPATIAVLIDRDSLAWLSRMRTSWHSKSNRAMNVTNTPESAS